MSGVNLVFNILNEEIEAYSSSQFVELIEKVLNEGFNSAGFDIEIESIHRN